jgi:hypothetical protein
MYQVWSNPLKDVDSSVHKDVTEGRTDGRTDGSVTIFHLTKLGTYLVLKRIWNPIDFQGQRSRSPGQIFTM